MRRPGRVKTFWRASGSARSARSTTATRISRHHPRLTDGRGVDVVLDMVGGDYVSKNLEVLAMDGRLLNRVPARAALRREPQPADAEAITFTGVDAASAHGRREGAIARALEREVWPLIFSSGEVRPVLHAVFPLAGAGLTPAEPEAGQHASARSASACNETTDLRATNYEFFERRTLLRTQNTELGTWSTERAAPSSVLTARRAAAPLQSSPFSNSSFLWSTQTTHTGYPHEQQGGGWFPHTGRQRVRPDWRERGDYRGGKCQTQRQLYARA